MRILEFLDEIKDVIRDDTEEAKKKKAKKRHRR
jgi:hypothetical protein